MRNALFYGCGTALVTPFHGSQVDFDALENLIDWQIDAGADALVVLGTTGEPAAITGSERSAILECAAARCAHRVPLIVGTGSNDTRAAMAMSAEAQRAGADAVLVVTPYYNRASASGLVAHYTAIADRLDIPVIAYNVPSRTGVNLEPRLMAQLARHPNLCAIKDASGSPGQWVGLAECCGDGVALYCGNDDQVIPAMSLGARGVISVAANVIPARMHALAASWLQGDRERALSIQLECLPLIRALFCEVSPIPVKAALHLMGLIENSLRLPLTPLSEDATDQLRCELKRLKLI